MRKQSYFFLLLNLLLFYLSAQNINSIQEAMADYDYETALLLISKEE